MKRERETAGGACNCSKDMGKARQQRGDMHGGGQQLVQQQEVGKIQKRERPQDTRSNAHKGGGGGERERRSENVCLWVVFCFCKAAKRLNAGEGSQAAHRGHTGGNQVEREEHKRPVRCGKAALEGKGPSSESWRV